MTPEQRPSAPDSSDDTTATTRPSDGAPPGTSFYVLIIGLAFLMNTVGRGVTETFAVFLLPVQQGLGATRAEILATYSIFAMSYGLSAPFVGQLIDRLGVRTTYVFGLGVLGLGYTLAGSVTEPWQYYLAVGLCGGLGSAALGMIVASSILSRWFTRRMGSVISLPYAAVGAGMLIVPPLAQLLLDAFGWRLAHRILGLTTVALIGIVVLLPLGRITAGSAEWRTARASATNASGQTSRWSVAAALRTSAFWGLASAYFWTSIAAYSVLPQSVAYLVERGFDPLFAASAFGMTGALSTLGIIAIGHASDRFGRLPTVTVSYLMTMTGTTCLLLVGVWPSLALVYGFVLFFGLVQGARGPIIVSTLSQLYQGGAVGGIFGTLSIAMGVGQAGGAWISGLLQQTTGDYRASFALGITGSALGMASFWAVGSLRNENAVLTSAASNPVRPSPRP